MKDSNSRALGRSHPSSRQTLSHFLRSSASVALVFWALTGSLWANEGFWGKGLDNQTFKKEFKGGALNLPSQSPSGIHRDNRYSKKEISFRSWDKHFSSLGQKKIYSEKSNTSTFNRQFKKEIKAKKELDLATTSWNRQLASIRKEARIKLSDEAHILGDREAYNLVLQERQFFRDMAENMDLRSINRYQFRSNRPEGPIPVDSISEAKATDQ